MILGAIAEELQAVGARRDAIEASPQLQATPEDVALQIRQEAGRLEKSQIARARVALEGFERGRETLGRVAFVERRVQHDRRIVWTIDGGTALLGAVLGTMLFMEVNRRAPDGLGWPASWAAWLMQADTVQAGYKLIGRNAPNVVAVLRGDIRLGNPYADERKEIMRGGCGASRQGTAMHPGRVTAAPTGERAVYRTIATYEATSADNFMGLGQYHE